MEISDMVKNAEAGKGCSVRDEIAGVQDLQQRIQIFKDMQKQSEAKAGLHHLHVSIDDARGESDSTMGALEIIMKRDLAPNPGVVAHVLEHNLIGPPTETLYDEKVYPLDLKKNSVWCGELR